MKNKRFLIAAGGTGGHFYPGLAMGLALREKGASVSFIVRTDEPAIAVLKENNFDYREIDLRGLPRSVNPMRHVHFLRKLTKALRATREIIKEFQPDVCVGTGGYISFPLLVCARWANIKTAVHDSNSHLGLVNKICGKFATLFMLGLPLKNPPKNGVLTSTPLRPEFAKKIDRTSVLRHLKLSEKLPTVLVVGGSQGAKRLNEAIVQVARRMPAWQFIHITGSKWFEPLKAQYEKCANVRVFAYSHEIYALMKSADLTICRSGAGTVAELIACKLPAICVPFPHAAADHQFFNAQILARAGAAEIIRESEFLAEQLRASLAVKSPQVLAQMRKAYDNVEVPSPVQSATRISDLLVDL